MFTPHAHRLFATHQRRERTNDGSGRPREPAGRSIRVTRKRPQEPSSMAHWGPFLAVKEAEIPCPTLGGGNRARPIP
jgi:hypothetical protein